MIVADETHEAHQSIAGPSSGSPLNRLPRVVEPAALEVLEEDED